MLPFRRILFPVDYSAGSEVIVPYVKDITGHFHAELTLLHAYGPTNMLYGELLTAESGWPQRLLTFEENRLKRFAGIHFPSQHVNFTVCEEEAGTAIQQHIEHHGTDLVMMPTRGKGPLRRLLVGSTTAKVLHDVSSAVWTCAVPSNLPAHVSPKSILCALDQTDEAEAVLKAAAAIACSYKAQLLMLHAVPTPPMALEVDFSVYRKDLMDAADSQLREMKGRLGIEAPHVVTSRSMFDAIQEEAHRVNADLLVVGRGESQGMVARIWSNLYPIIREAPCPVVSI